MNKKVQCIQKEEPGTNEKQKEHTKKKRKNKEHSEE